MGQGNAHRNFLGKLATRYNEALDEATLTYLADRGIDKDAAHGSLLGLCADPDPLHESYRGRLSIPYITPSGVVSIRFRCLSDHDCKQVDCKKYLQGTGEPDHVYNVQALHDADTVVGVCGGEIDALSATLAGLPSVGIPGETKWKNFWSRLFDDFERVIVLGDGDKAGRDFASKLANDKLTNAEARVLPDSEDVNSFIVKEGQQAFLEYIDLTSMQE